MKKQVFKFALAVLFFTFSNLIIAQKLDTIGFNYQAVARDASGIALGNKAIVVEISIRKGSETGNTLWQETHEVKTNSFGLFSVIIGRGNTTGVGSLNSFNEIDWSQKDMYTGVRADFGNGLLPMGNVQLQAVPYAFVADTALAAPRFNLKELLDVDVNNLTKNDILKWDGSKWVSGQLSLSDFTSIYSKIQSDSTALRMLINANASDISNNTSNILTNAGNIIQNTTAISSIETLADGKIYLGNTSNEATEVTMRGDVTMDNTGVTTIADGAVGDQKLVSGINATKIADGTVDNNEFQYIDGATSNIQTQLDSKSDLTLSNLSNVETARTNLGLGTIATQDSSDVSISGGSINGTSIGSTKPSEGKFTTLSTTGQVGIGTTTPDPSAAIDISSSNGVLIMPRLTSEQIAAISNPVNGSIVYNTTTNKFQGNITKKSVKVFADNIYSNVYYFKDYARIGQSFQSPFLGKLNKIGLYFVDKDAPLDIKIYEGLGDNGVLISSFSYTGGATRESGYESLSIFDVSNQNIFLKENEQYTIMFSSSDLNNGLYYTNSFGSSSNFMLRDVSGSLEVVFNRVLNLMIESTTFPWVDLH